MSKMIMYDLIVKKLNNFVLDLEGYIDLNFYNKEDSEDEELYSYLDEEDIEKVGDIMKRAKMISVQLNKKLDKIEDIE